MGVHRRQPRRAGRRRRDRPVLDHRRRRRHRRLRRRRDRGPPTSWCTPMASRDIEVTDIVTATNAEAAELTRRRRRPGRAARPRGRAQHRLRHDGHDRELGLRRRSSTASSGDVDAIVSGHTHLAYNCSFPVARVGRPARSRTARWSRPASTATTSTRWSSPSTPTPASVLAATPRDCQHRHRRPSTADPAVQAIVDEAKSPTPRRPARSSSARSAAPFKRARGPRPTARLRGEPRWRVHARQPGRRGAALGRPAPQIAFMNPGGLRADMVAHAEAGYPADGDLPAGGRRPAVRQHAGQHRPDRRPDQEVLEQQWQPDGRLAAVPAARHSRASPTPTTRRARAGSPAMWLNGKPVDADDDLHGHGQLASSPPAVTTSATFRRGPDKRDTGQTDLQAMVDYMAEFASDQPLHGRPEPARCRRRTARGAPTTYGAGDTLSFDLSSLAMTGAGDVQDEEVIVSVGSKDLGTFPVDNTVAPGATDDEAGKASVSIDAAGRPAGRGAVRHRHRRRHQHPRAHPGERSRRATRR